MNTNSRKKSRAAGARQHRNEYSWNRILRLYVTYWLVIFSIVTLSLFSIMDLLHMNTALVLFGGTLVAAAVVTVLHVRNGSKDRVDEIAGKLP